MKQIVWLGISIAAAVSLGPWLLGSDAAQNQNAVAPAAAISAIGAISGELIYVPVYSRIYYEDGKSTLELAATLSIHNVNPEQSITVSRADYYNTAGTLIHQYVTAPLVLRPLETKHLIIEKANTAGGVGANFLVAWNSEQAVSPPLVEALMVNASHNLGIAFTSAGRVIQRSGTPVTK